MKINRLIILPISFILGMYMMIFVFIDKLIDLIKRINKRYICSKCIFIRVKDNHYNCNIKCIYIS